MKIGGAGDRKGFQVLRDLLESGFRGTAGIGEDADGAIVLFAIGIVPVRACMNRAQA